MPKRIMFCGVIEGEVTPRPGESKERAIARAKQAIQHALDRGAKRYGRYEIDGRGAGPTVGLEDPDQ